MRKLLLMRTLVLVAATGWIATDAVTVLAQQKPNTTVYYDQYEPSQRQRLRRETCARDEEPVGPYCTKACEKGYLPVKGSKPPRCRAIEPLAPGVMPTAVRKQVGVQAPPPEPQPPRHKGDGKG